MLSQCSLGDYGAYYDSFLELHIEQGPELEEENLSLGVVTAIAHLPRYDVPSQATEVMLVHNLCIGE